MAGEQTAAAVGGKKRRAPAAPKPFYLVFSINSQGNGIDIHAYSRKTDAVVEAMQEHPGCMVEKLDTPTGR